MWFNWHVPLPGPFSVGGNIFRTRRRRGRRRKVWHGTLSDASGRVYWTCAHNHQRLDTAEDCAGREDRRRARQGI